MWTIFFNNDYKPHKKSMALIIIFAVITLTRHWVVVVLSFFIISLLRAYFDTFFSFFFANAPVDVNWSVKCLLPFVFHNVKLHSALSKILIDILVNLLLQFIHTMWTVLHLCSRVVWFTIWTIILISEKIPKWLKNSSNNNIIHFGFDSCISDINSAKWTQTASCPHL